MISLGLAVGTTGFAVKSGDRTARRFGLAFLAAWVGSLVVSKLHLPGGATLAIFCIDSATLIYFTRTSLGSRRLWTAVATALMLLIVASHVATAIDFRVTLDTFRLSMALWSYGILACIGFGAWSSRREPSRTLVLAAR